MEDYDVLEDAEDVVKDREDYYLDTKYKIITHLTNYVYENQIDQSSIDNLICTFCNNVDATMTIEDVADIARTIYSNLEHENSEDIKTAFQLAKMNPYYHAHRDEKNNLSISMQNKDDFLNSDE